MRCISYHHDVRNVVQVMVVGDVHGQYFDLLNILKKWRPDHSLLFLGDYVGEKPDMFDMNSPHPSCHMPCLRSSSISMQECA